MMASMNPVHAVLTSPACACTFGAAAIARVGHIALSRVQQRVGPEQPGRPFYLFLRHRNGPRARTPWGASARTPTWSFGSARLRTVPAGATRGPPVFTAP